MAVLKKWQIVVLVGTIFMLCSFIVSPRPILKTDNLQMDAASYISHAFTLGLDFDLDYSNEPVDTSGYGYFNDRTQLPSHPIGPGVLAAPFVAVFSLFDRLTGHPIVNNHKDYAYSWSKFGFLFAGILFFFIAIYLYQDVADRIAPGFSHYWVLIIGAGTGVLYYAYHDGYLGHQFEFFSLALVIWGCTVAWDRARRQQPYNLFLLIAAVGVALAHLIRPANVNAVMLPAITLLALGLLTPGKTIGTPHIKQLVIRSLLIMAPVLVALGGLYYMLYDTPFPLPGDMYGEDRAVVADALSGVDPTLGSPVVALVIELLGRMRYIPGIIFGLEFGLLYTGPIMLVGFLALIFATVTAAGKKPVLKTILLILSILYVAIPGAIVLQWQTTASAYGWRYLFGIIALGFLGLYVAYSLRQRNNSFKPIEAVVRVLLVLSVIGIFSQVFFGVTPRLHYHAGENTFGKIHGTENCCSGIGYMTNLAQDVAKPSTWAGMAAHRFPGFFVAVLLQPDRDDLEQFGQKLGISTDKLQAGLERYSAVPMSAILQVLAIYLFSALASLYLVLREPRPYERPG